MVKHQFTQLLNINSIIMSEYLFLIEILTSLLGLNNCVQNLPALLGLNNYFQTLLSTNNCVQNLTALLGEKIPSFSLPLFSPFVTRTSLGLGWDAPREGKRDRQRANMSPHLCQCVVTFVSQSVSVCHLSCTCLRSVECVGV